MHKHKQIVDLRHSPHRGVAAKTGSLFYPLELLPRDIVMLSFQWWI